MEYFNGRQREEFHTSCPEFLAKVPDIQFFIQLIQQLALRSIQTNKANELWFNIQGCLTRFGLQEYVVVMRLKCGLAPEGNQFTQLIEKSDSRINISN